MSERKGALYSVLRFKDLRNPYLYAGLLGRIAGVQARSGEYTTLLRLIDRQVGRAIGEGVIARQLPEHSVYSDIEYWHGTGRYQYSRGAVVDVLGNIARTRTLLPSYDAFDLTRPMQSISLARSRVYGRAYADMHGTGSREKERYGSSLFWACAFLGDIAVEASLETRVWRPHGYRRMMDHLFKADALQWYKKLTRASGNTVVDIYKDGSDIPDNYPVLFGVRRGSIIPSSTSKAVAIHESRSECSIPLDDAIVHVEVPRSRLIETRGVLGGIAVASIEDGERWSANFPFSSHIAGNV